MDQVKEETEIDIKKGQAEFLSETDPAEKKRREKFPKYFKLIKSKAKEAKEKLTDAPFADIEFEIGEEAIACTITRDQFEEFCKDEFERCMKVVHRTLDNANLKEKDIDRVLMVGGSSRALKIQEMLR